VAGFEEDEFTQVNLLKTLNLRLCIAGPFIFDSNRREIKMAHWTKFTESM
jgi:hypothetical protein